MSATQAGFSPFLCSAASGTRVLLSCGSTREKYAALLRVSMSWGI
jgi:hypothetical protein